MEIVEKPINEITLYEGNARIHGEGQVSQLSASIKEFGFTNPVLLDENDVVIAGHGRLLAATQLGLQSVPTITLSHLTDAQKKAYVIADNKLALNSEWNYEQLKLEMFELGELDYDIELTGFPSDIYESMGGFVPNTEPKFSPSEVTSNDIETGGENITATVQATTSDKASQGKEVICPHCMESFRVSGG